jgi:uncharacterized Zn finger protein (UPF0148 family)
MRSAGTDEDGKMGCPLCTTLLAGVSLRHHQRATVARTRDPKRQTVQDRDARAYEEDDVLLAPSTERDNTMKEMLSRLDILVQRNKDATALSSVVEKKVREAGAPLWRSRPAVFHRSG